MRRTEPEEPQHPLCHHCGELVDTPPIVVQGRGYVGVLAPLILHRACIQGHCNYLVECALKWDAEHGPKLDDGGSAPPMMAYLQGIAHGRQQANEGPDG